MKKYNVNNEMTNLLMTDITDIQHCAVLFLSEMKYK